MTDLISPENWFPNTVHCLVNWKKSWLLIWPLFFAFIEAVSALEVRFILEIIQFSLPNKRQESHQLILDKKVSNSGSDITSYNLQ